MIKQVYRFLSVLIISNLIFSQSVLSKQQNNVNNTRSSKIVGIKKLLKENSGDKDDIIDSTAGVERYGLCSPRMMLSTYPRSYYQSMKKREPIPPSQGSKNSNENKN